jgi:hypothetical protein
MSVTEMMMGDCKLKADLTQLLATASTFNIGFLAEESMSKKNSK